MAAKDEDINAVQKQELEESTTCCICMEIYKCPKLLPCGHTFCMNCIQETGLKTSKGPGDEMPCPICRQQFRIPSEGFILLQNNYYIESLVRVAKIFHPSVAASIACDACLEENRDESGRDVQRADMYCRDCKQKLCEECCRHHRKLKLTKNHRLISINGQRPTDEDLIQSLATSVCELHKQEDLKIYCRGCKAVVCDICFTEHHEGHKGTHITNAVNDFRKEIANYVQKVKTRISEAEMKKSELTKAKQDLHKKSESLQSYINGRKDDIKEIAEKHAKSLLEELFSIKQSMMKEIHMKTDDIDAQLMRLETYNAYCEKIMTKGSPCDICLSVGDLSTRVNELQQENQPLIEQKLKPFTLCFTETELEEGDAGNLLGQLQKQDYPKHKTKTKDILTKELSEEVEYLKTEIKKKITENETLKLENEKQISSLNSVLKAEMNKEKVLYNAYVDQLNQELEFEKFKNTVYLEEIENLREQQHSESAWTKAETFHDAAMKYNYQGNEDHPKVTKPQTSPLISKSEEKQKSKSSADALRKSTVHHRLSSFY